MSRTADVAQTSATASRHARRLRVAGRWAAIGACVLALGAGAALWASEGARVFADAALSAVLACL